MTDLLNNALKLADKREEYCKKTKPCLKCGTNQVQLVDWIDGAEWKCRHCKHEWKGTTNWYEDSDKGKFWMGILFIITAAILFGGFLYNVWHLWK